MAFLDYWGDITKILDKGLDIFDQLVVDKDLREKLKNDFRMRNLELESAFKLAFMRLSEKIIDAEIATGAKWRTPCIAVSGILIALMCFNNYILYTYMPENIKFIEIPIEIWYTFWGLCGLHLFDFFRFKNKKDIDQK